MLRSRLERGHDIVGELSDGYAAASEVEETQPDVVIMDFKMPTVSGIHATRAVKALFPHVVVVGFTSSEEAMTWHVGSQPGRNSICILVPNPPGA